jgi:hypothetical protein
MFIWDFIFKKITDLESFLPSFPLITGTILTIHIIFTAEQWARTLKVDKAKIVQMSGLRREDVYDYQNEGRRETSNLEEESH